MGRNDDVIQLMVRNELIGWMYQLHPHDDGQQPSDHPGNDCEQKVKGADILVVGRTKPAGEEPRCVAVAINVMAVQVRDVDTALVSNFSLPRTQFPAGAGRAVPVVAEPEAAATRTASSPPSLWANFFLASPSQRWKSSFDTASILIGMKA